MPIVEQIQSNAWLAFQVTIVLAAAVSIREILVKILARTTAARAAKEATLEGVKDPVGSDNTAAIIEACGASLPDHVKVRLAERRALMDWLNERLSPNDRDEVGARLNIAMMAEHHAGIRAAVDVLEIIHKNLPEGQTKHAISISLKALLNLHAASGDLLETLRKSHG